VATRFSKDNWTVLKNQASLTEVILVIGYLAEQIEAKVKRLHDSGLKIKTIYNPFFDVSNNLISLWLSMTEMHSDFMITNGDNLFDPDIFKNIDADCKDGVYLTVFKKEHYDDDDMKVTLSGSQLVEVNKQILPTDTDCESPGLVLVKGESSLRLFRKNLDEIIREVSSRDDSSLRLFRKNLDEIIREVSSRDDYWLVLFNKMVANGNLIETWQIPTGMKWQEVDFHLDITKVIELLDVSKLDLN